ncbi:MAG: Cys-tRNA(Pro) deacylase [Actinomycetes bacterium]
MPPDRHATRAGAGPAATPATRVLAVAGVPYTVHAYVHDPGVREYGREAAAALDVDPDRVFKTLLVEADGQLGVAVIPVPDLLDLKAWAQVRGARRAALAEPGTAERVTGYVIGGISPLGQRRGLPTVIDSSAAGHRTILVSAGRRGLDVELAPEDLRQLTEARLAPIRRPRSDRGGRLRDSGSG